MPTLIDWNALEHKAKSYIGQFDHCDSLRASFAHLVLEYVLTLDPEEIEDAITDGGNDRGIDAVYVDERDGKNTVHLFQFKCAETFENSKKNFPSNEIDKLLSFVVDVLDKSANLKKTCNPILYSKVQEIWDALERPNPIFEVHFSSNQLPLVTAERRRVDEALSRYRTFTINEHHLDAIVGLFIERKHPKTDALLKIVDKNYFERTDGNIRGLIATLEGEAVANLITDPKDPSRVLDSIFNDNVRVYLTRKNQINRKIIASAESDSNTTFWYLNNGITMTCDSFSYQPDVRAPLVTLKNVQIVNGGQTSHALFEVKKSSPEQLKKVLVLVRIYETKTKELSSAIAESTNSQTPINTRDLRSNDDLQKKLEESFSALGLFYERKAKQHCSQPRAKRVDALASGQAYLAYFLEMPEVAKKDRSRVFSDLYEQVFNDGTSPKQFIASLDVLAAIDKLKRSIKKKIKKNEKVDARMMFVIDGAYHVLYAVSQYCLRNDVNRESGIDATKFVPKAIELVAKLVESEIKADKTFTFNRFFKDTKTKAKIEALVARSRPFKKDRRRTNG